MEKEYYIQAILEIMGVINTASYIGVPVVNPSIVGRRLGSVSSKSKSSPKSINIRVPLDVRISVKAPSEFGRCL